MPRVSIDTLEASNVLVRGLDQNYNWGLPVMPEGQVHALPQVSSIFQLQYRAASAWMGSVTTQATLGAFAHNVGIPKHAEFEQIMAAVLEPFKDQLEEFAQEIKDRLIEVTEDAIRLVVDVIFEALDPAMELITSIPVYGWVVDIIWGIAKSIKGFVEMARGTPPPEQEVALPQYSSDSDTQAFNVLLGTVRQSLDWTTIFMPPKVGAGPGGIGNIGRFGVINYVSKAIGVVSTGSETGGLGLIPGVARVHGSWMIPHHLMESGMGMITDVGTLLPQIQAQHAYLWKQMSVYTQQTDAPALYYVDAKKLEATWSQFVWDFWNFLAGKGHRDPEFSAPVMNAFGHQVNMSSAGDKGPFYGMFDSDNKLRTPSESKVQDILCVNECSILRKRQWALLNTPMCAYLESDMGSLNDMDLKRRWDERKLQLLSHPARCTVSLEDVRDVIYLQYLQESNMSAAACAAVPFKLAAGPDFRPPARMPTGNPGSGLPPGTKKMVFRKPGRLRPRGVSPVVKVAGAAGLAFGLSKLLGLKL